MQCGEKRNQYEEEGFFQPNEFPINLYHKIKEN